MGDQTNLWKEAKIFRNKVNKVPAVIDETGADRLAQSSATKFCIDKDVMNDVFGKVEKQIADCDDRGIGDSLFRMPDFYI